MTAATTPAQLAGAVVDEYHDALTSYPRTISALDLGQAGAAEKFDSRGYFVINLDDEYLDLYDFARLIKQNVPDAGVRAAAQGVMDEVGCLRGRRAARKRLLSAVPLLGPGRRPRHGQLFPDGVRRLGVLAENRYPSGGRL